MKAILVAVEIMDILIFVVKLLRESSMTGLGQCHESSAALDSAQQWNRNDERRRAGGRLGGCQQLVSGA